MSINYIPIIRSEDEGKTTSTTLFHQFQGFCKPGFCCRLLTHFSRSYLNVNFLRALKVFILCDLLNIKSSHNRDIQINVIYCTSLDLKYSMISAVFSLSVFKKQSALDAFYN